jgi:pimeloyl-ACP methyl ester carboxylesterase
VSESDLQIREIELHGHRVCYRLAGEGPLIVLVHGITSTSATWESVIPRLARRHTVLAPDLLGHGESAKPRGDYSLGAHASGVRDLAGALGFDRGTILGHSLGGGVAMQFAYQFPQNTERLVLVSSGGLGREVHLLLRAATLPGSELMLPLLASDRLVGLGRGIAGLIGRAGLRAGTDLEEIARGIASLAEPDSRAAFLHSLRAAVDVGGQRVSATDRLYLAERMPTLIVWGVRDSIIPAYHGAEAHEAMPGSRLEVLDAGHYPHLDDPLRFVEVLEDFLEYVPPADVALDDFRDLLQQGARA